MIPSQAAFIGAKSFPAACWIGIEQPTAVRANIHILIRANHIVLEPSSQIASPFFLDRFLAAFCAVFLRCFLVASSIAVSCSIRSGQILISLISLILRRNKNFAIMQT